MTKNTRLNSSSDWEYFDDCPICQAMRIADEAGRKLTPEELTNAFEVAKFVTPYAGALEDLKTTL